MNTTDACRHDPKRETYPWSVQQDAWFPEYLDFAVQVPSGQWMRRSEFLDDTYAKKPPWQMWMPARGAPRIIPHSKNTRKTWIRTSLWNLQGALREAREDRTKGRAVRVRNWCTNKRIMLP